MTEITPSVLQLFLPLKWDIKITFCTYSAAIRTGLFKLFIF